MVWALYEGGVKLIFSKIRQGIDIIVIPRNPDKEIFHKEAKNLEDRTIKLPLIDLKMIVYFLISLILKPSIWIIIISFFRVKNFYDFTEEFNCIA